MENYFESALRNFTTDFASGDAIRHLADKGMTVYQIAENLTYPTGIEKIAEVVWKHYLDNGTIRLEMPEDSNAPQVKVEYVLEHNKYGRTSYRRVENPVSDSKLSYVECDFGKRLYNDKNNLINDLSKLDKNDRDYILSLPWPLQNVYHIANERMERIRKLV